MNIFELTEDVREVEARLDEAMDALVNGEPEAEEMAQVWRDTLEGLKGSVEQKIVNMAKVAREKRLKADMVKAERQRLDKKLKALENAETQVRSYMAWAMNEHQINKVGDDFIGVTYGQGRPKVVVRDICALMDIGEVWKPYKYDEVNLDKTMIKEKLSEGINIPGVELVTERVLTIR